MKIKESDQGVTITEQTKRYANVGSFIGGASSSQNTMVGFDRILDQIMDALTGDESNLQILSVVGMGGIGKTTLARHIFSHSSIVDPFDLHAWVTISQQYSVHEILLGLIKETKVVEGEGKQLTGRNVDELGLRLHQILYCRRYFIVMDDMWSIKVWNDIKRFFPDDGNGSRILVFGKSESCPLELEEIGKTIVRNCGGLPLAIAAISGLLAKSSQTVEYWESVADGTYEALNMDGFCFKILSLSYRQLPVHLKPCFLYMAIYPEDSIIKISRLVQLWVAEGIVKPEIDRSLEEVAEDNLKDLIDRNLIKVRDYGSRNNIKSCTIHDLLRELCLKEAEKEKFLCVAKIHGLNSHPRSINNMRRLIIQLSLDIEEFEERRVFDADAMEFEERSSDEEEFEERSSDEEVLDADAMEFEERSSDEEVLDADAMEFEERSSDEEVFDADAMKLASCTRSLIIFPDSDDRPIKLPVRSRLLRVLSIGSMHSLEEIRQLVNLRCIHSENWSFPNQFLESLSRTWNLQAVNLASKYGDPFEELSLPTEIWEMPHLRHLKSGAGYFYLPDPPSTNSKTGRRDIFELKNLQTLYKMLNFRCTDEVLHRIPNLKKLGIVYAYLLSSDGFGWDHYEVYNLAHLRNLETFTLETYYKLPQNLCFPSSLKKLTLSDCKVSWEYLTVVGTLPHLEALNLMYNAVVGREWNPVEGQFLKLKYLRIVDTDLEEWVADSSHFPNLEKLALYSLDDLKEIPCGLGEIGTLRSISLSYCSSSASDSAEKIQEEQQQLGNTDLQVIVVKIKKPSGL
ncbi:hypothetical protein F511_14357 [Dorcoceras hygrometricum]|uniref:NB-ARC domain-containing protein n=1 Tax=Dorcoceras hygrometricum TaxID=472368 RepID=A0A2Z7A3Z1_9LAMI|nr:hypothetical protein F511_14357 [Dorcoceras hygrometricum]